MVVRLQIENKFSGKLDKELEMDSPISGVLLRNELRFCRYALESELVMGNYNAMSVCYTDNYEYTKSSQSKCLNKEYYTENLNGIK